MKLASAPVALDALIIGPEAAVWPLAQADTDHGGRHRKAAPQKTLPPFGVHRVTKGILRSFLAKSLLSLAHEYGAENHLHALKVEEKDGKYEAYSLFPPEASMVAGGGERLQVPVVCPMWKRVEGSEHYE